jgi:hypothetical protein
MKNLFLLLMVCSIFVLPSCQKDHSNPGDGNPKPFVYDTDAQAFFTGSGITDTVQKTAINDLVIALKKDSLWNKFVALYPMVGGNSASTSFNLKDPRNVDAAYRITWHGSPDFKTTGVT